MQSKKLLVIFLISAILIASLISIYFLTKESDGKSADAGNISTDAIIANNVTLNLSYTNTSVSQNNSLFLPPVDDLINKINWSRYPILTNPVVPVYEVSAPTDVVNHAFIYLRMVVDVKDISDRDEIFKELSGIMVDERAMLGPNSGPTIWGTWEGIWSYYAALHPYENEVYIKYLP